MKEAIAMAESQANIAALHTQLINSHIEVVELTEVALNNLEFQVLFLTGSDRLSVRAEQRVSTLSKFLKQHPNLCVELGGYADPRGTDEYNNVLSDYRALAVQTALELHGIGSDRIVRRAFGANRSHALKGDIESYMKERRVEIKMFNPYCVEYLTHTE